MQGILKAYWHPESSSLILLSNSKDKYGQRRELRTFVESQKDAEEMVRFLGLVLVVEVLG